MKRARVIGALTVVVISLISPAQAEIIIDQSRISTIAPKAPNLDLVNWKDSGTVASIH